MKVKAIINPGSRIAGRSRVEQTLRAIDHPHFGLIYEAANLEICGQQYGPEIIKRLAPWIENVYLQNQQLTPEGEVTLDTWGRGPVSFNVTQIHEPGGVDFESVFAGLKSIGYDGTVTVHQSPTSAPDPSHG